MSDIIVKPVDSPKEPSVEVPLPEAVENEVDPLAIDEEVGKLKETKPEEKAGCCDENAKEESVSESQNEDSDNLALQSEKIKGKALINNSRL